MTAGAAPTAVEPAAALQPSDPLPALRWEADFFDTRNSGSPVWDKGSLFLDRPGLCFLRNSGSQIVEGRHLRDGEWIREGSEMLLLDRIVHVGAKVVLVTQQQQAIEGNYIDLTSVDSAPDQASGSRFW